jgi:hypothetical protein
MDFRDAFVLWRGLGIDYEGGVLANPARVAIHFTHRLGAVIAGSVLIASGSDRVRARRRRAETAGPAVLVFAVLLQISIGVATVHWGVPLPLATCTMRAPLCWSSHGDPAARAVAGAGGAGWAWYPCAHVDPPDSPPLAAPSSAPAAGAISGAHQAQGEPADRVHRHRRHGAGIARHGAAAGADVRHLGIAMASGSAAAFNHVLDRRIDEQMARTRRRPLPTGHLQKRQAVIFASLLAVASMLVLWRSVGNGSGAALTFCSLIGYAMVYTLWLKRATPQNIVIGGAAGAAPPVLGWAAVTHTIDPQALLLFLIIFTWTPPHFWALAIARRDDYAKVGIPMLPVTHGIPTRACRSCCTPSCWS